MVPIVLVDQGVQETPMAQVAGLAVQAVQETPVGQVTGLAADAGSNNQSQSTRFTRWRRQCDHEIRIR